jgi:hypothetical protein
MGFARSVVRIPFRAPGHPTPMVGAIRDRPASPPRLARASAARRFAGRGARFHPGRQRCRALEAAAHWPGASARKEDWKEKTALGFLLAGAQGRSPARDLAVLLEAFAMMPRRRLRATPCTHLREGSDAAFPQTPFRFRCARLWVATPLVRHARSFHLSTCAAFAPSGGRLTSMVRSAMRGPAMGFARSVVRIPFRAPGHPTSMVGAIRDRPVSLPRLARVAAARRFAGCGAHSRSGRRRRRSLNAAAHWPGASARTESPRENRARFSLGGAQGRSPAGDVVISLETFATIRRHLGHPPTEGTPALPRSRHASALV